MTEFTQDGKQLRIDTKLAADKLLLIGIDGQEAISTPFSYRVEMLSPDHNIKAEDVIGSMARVSMAKDPEAADFDRRFNGFFASFVRGPRNGKRKELRHYSGELVPWFALLQHSSNCRIFQDKTVAEVIEKTLND